jgi:hypothetical protein
LRGGAEAEAFREYAGPDGRLVVHADFEQAVRALGLPDPEKTGALMAHPDSRSDAEGRHATAAVALPGRSERIHLRPVRHGGWLGPLWRGRVLGLARPTRELFATEALRARGAPVPRAVLVAGWRSGPLWSAVFGTLHEEQALDGLAWLQRDPDDARIAACAAAAGRAVRAFHDAGGHHADLHLKNLLVHEREDACDVLVIDLDGARSGAPPDPARRMRELMRLYRSLVKRRRLGEVGNAGCLAAFRAYCDGDRALRRALLARLPDELRRVARHARGYR